MNETKQGDDREDWIRGDFMAGVIDRPPEVESILSALDAAGFPKASIRVFLGARGSEELGHIGGTGLSGWLHRAAADYAGNARELTDRLKAEAARGHHVLIVPVEGSASATQVRQVFEMHGGYDIFGRIGGSFQTYET